MHFIFSNFFLYINLFFSLFALINPIGMVPIFTAMTYSQSKLERKKINYIANISVFFILSMSLFLGDIVLNFFGISMSAFQISGGILVASIAFSMINGTLTKKNNLKKQKIITENIGVVPLAMPLIAGPGSISATIMWGSQHSGIIHTFLGIMIIGVFTFFCWILFQTADTVLNVLGTSGINIITRIMGLLLMALGIELILQGIISFLSIFI
ncbi:YchE family NAAT transporter [Buchnera aphidicola (Thelaxes californica)]|uniref:UPF0056 membrane protein n=1 Tax=Buchnera aphidicola (Thelaxes californica) TaxID=1315998 RepID=A0A4D6YJN8_9GAMM|nr:YchE family NAAT transporter [Buchnera aphidicola]QCI26741.1 YchE family NAAT transporter [Buchnera aphidicola (Thelaxes californica)]